jgi:hypothetical protein
MCNLKNQGDDDGAIVVDSENKAIVMVIGGAGDMTAFVPMKGLCKALNVEILN